MPWKLLASVIVLAASAPVAAQSVFDTHAELSVPAGKTPTRIFRPLARNTCVVSHRPHLAGKLPMIVAATADARTCDVVVASADTAPVKGVAH